VSAVFVVRVPESPASPGARDLLHYSQVLDRAGLDSFDSVADILDDADGEFLLGEVGVSGHCQDRGSFPRAQRDGLPGGYGLVLKNKRMVAERIEQVKAVGVFIVPLVFGIDFAGDQERIFVERVWVHI